MKYASVRGIHRDKTRLQNRTRSRVATLPATAAVFLCSLVALAAFYHVSNHPSRDPQLPAAIHALQPVSRSGSDYGELCTKPNDIFSNKLSLAFLIPGIVFCFVGLAIVTDDYFVSALELICERLNLSEDVAGATFMAAGSSAPEFFISMISVFDTADEVGIGTIVGSAVFNLLVIIGLSAALAGAILKLDWRPLMRDSSFYILSICLLLLFTIGSSKGRIDWWEGLLLVLTYISYVLFMAYLNKPYMAWAARISGMQHDDHPSDPAAKEASEEAANLELGQVPTSNTTPPRTDPATSEASISRLQAAAAALNVPLGGATPETKRRYRDLNPRTRLKVAQYAVIATRRLVSSSSENSDSGVDENPRRTTESETPATEETRTWTRLRIPIPSSLLGWIIFPLALPWHVLFRLSIVDCSVNRLQKWYAVTFALSIVWISAISYLMVTATRLAGCLVGIPASALGLTFLAAGTSVPDALASVSVAREGAGNMAVSNAIGSNVFDILLGLGLPWFLGDLILAEGIKIPVEPLARVIVPIIILFAIMAVFLVILVAMRWQMRPLLGYLLFGLYFCFLTYALLDVFLFKFSES